MQPRISKFNGAVSSTPALQRLSLGLIVRRVVAVVLLVLANAGVVFAHAFAQRPNLI